MVYLEQFRFPDAEVEFDFFLRQKRTCYDTYYPFQILSKHRFEQIDFEPVTILYGGNGTGKSTALNIIAQKLHLLREAPLISPAFMKTIWNFAPLRVQRICRKTAGLLQVMMYLITC